MVELSSCQIYRTTGCTASRLNGRGKWWRLIHKAEVSIGVFSYADSNALRANVTAQRQQ
jgi:hypothetical protein